MGHGGRIRGEMTDYFNNTHIIDIPQDYRHYFTSGDISVNRVTDALNG